MALPVLQITRVSKTYPHQDYPALKDIHISVSANEHLGLIGANGSGKTTLFRLLMNFIRPDAGTIHILGSSRTELAKRNLGFVPEHQQGLDNFTPVELLNYATRMAGMNRRKGSKRIDELIRWVQLESQKNELISGFSKGMKQRLQLALSRVHNPPILLLDEPMSGLDPSGQKMLRSLLQELDQHTLLYASHNLTDIEDLCSRVIILHQGEIVKDLLIADQETEIFTVETPPQFLELLQKFKNIELRKTWPKPDGLRIEFLSPPAIVQELLTEAREQGIEIHRLRSRSTLEDYYERYVQKQEG